ENNSDAENIRQFIARCHGAGIKNLVLTPDFREISQQQVSEETIYGFALMVDEAERHGIPVLIRDEYLNPEQMRMVKKYIPLRWKGWTYRLHRAGAAAKATLARLVKRARFLRDAGKTERAIATAESLLEREGKILHPVQRIDEPAEPDAP